MPHIIVEYTANLDHLAWDEVLKVLHEAAAEMAELPLPGLRSRAHRCADFRVSDGKPENAFVHVVLRMGHGRSEEARERIGKHVFAALADHFRATFDERPLSVTLEVQEIHPVLNFRKANLREHFDKG